MSDASDTSAAAFETWERRLHAFAALADPAAARGGAGSLGGLRVGVKDIIDVAGLPTRNGSAACADASPAAQDAPAVAALRAAGAAILGKTVTTEFAFTDPTDCRNPHDLSRSPGGSSSGSGAAVGAGLVEVALGTQTAGSLCRPAAYCGAVGLKPSYGSIPTEGVTPLAPSFDTVGIIARSVETAGRAFAAMSPGFDAGAAKAPQDCVVAPLLLDPATPASAETLAAFDAAQAALFGIARAGAPPRLGIDVAAVVADHRVVMNREAFVAHGAMLDDARGARLRPKFAAGLRGGADVTPASAAAAAERLAQARAAFWDAAEGLDAILTLPVPDGAPKIDGTTGFQDWLTPWTVFRGPLIALPWGRDGLGRPRSVMLAGRPGGEATLLTLAEALQAASPPLPRPRLPAD